MKKTAYLLVVMAILCAAPVLAQGPFTDVPTDHWAYDAVNTLQKDGILIGYPDGTFAGKRTISRYEFAVAIARVMAKLAPEAMDLSKYALKSEIPTIPSIANLATKADVEALRKLINEFQDELAALGVDVDALKKDVAALEARVAALEAEVRRVRITGDANVFAVATDHRSGVVNAFDRDERQISTQATIARNLGVVRDFDLNIVGRVNASTTANATINYGNYLDYLVAVDDYIGGTRQTSRNDVRSFGPGALNLNHQFIDTFFPYYLYIDAALGKGEFVVGRFPIQFTPYTLKKIDVDSYTSILKTDDGNYPVDGAKVAYNFGGVDLTLFAAKNDENDFLANGLTGQPTAGIYDDSPNALPFFAGRTFNQVGGHAVGGLTAPITQTAGMRALIGIPWSGNLGLTFYQAWSQTAYGTFGVPGANYDQARVYGADLTIPFLTKFNFTGSWTSSDTLAREGVAVGDLTGTDDDGVAWDGKINATLGKIGIGAGYKDIGRNFAAAGAWDKIGRWTNPTNVKGPYADITVPILRNVDFVVNGEFLTVKDPTAVTGNTHLTKDDDVVKAEGGIKWGLSKTNALALGYEWVRFNPTTAGVREATESYLTIGWAHQVNANAGLKIGYQFINYDGGANTIRPTFAYGNEIYRAGLGVVQFGVTF